MNTTMFGADVEALEAAAGALCTSADELDASAHSLASALGALNWLGGVAVRFGDSWMARHQPGLVHTAWFLRESAERLREQAFQQRAASAAVSGQRSSTTASPSNASAQIPNGASPAEIEAWWNSLTVEQRQTLIDTSPQIIGNLDGIPFVDRFSANRTYMQRLLDGETSPDGPMHQRLQQFTDPSGQID
ncbi:MAG: hypothetical protein WCC60_19470, partial [Ilumatobacteraceae bacterium]